MSRRRTPLFAALFVLVATIAQAHLVVDVRLSVSAPAFVPVGQPFSYQVVADVLANDEAVDVVVTARLSPGVLYTGASGEGWACDGKSGVVTCSADEIRAGPNELSLHVVAPSAFGPINTLVSIVSNGSVDLNPANDRAAATTTVYDPAACAPASIQILQPGGDNAVVASPVRLAWSAVPNARGYEVYASVDGERSALVAATRETAVLVPFVSGHVEWRVDALFPLCPTIAAHTARFVSSGAPESLLLNTLAGASNRAGVADGPLEAAAFQAPTGLALDSRGNLFVADAGSNAIREVSQRTVTTPSGTAGAAGAVDGRPAAFNGPAGIAISPADDFLFIADEKNQTVRMRYPGDRTLGYVITIGGAVGAPGADDGTGESSRFSAPAAVAVDPRGTVYVVDSGNNSIRKLTTVPDYIGYYTTATLTGGAAGSDDGSLPVARFRSPSGVAVDGETLVYVADSGNHTIRRIANRVVTTIAGQAGASGNRDGIGSDARFNNPTAIAVDQRGNAYVCDTGNSTIRKVSPTGVVTTVAGLDPGDKLRSPRGITIDETGAIYVSDTGNHRILIGRVVVPPVRRRATLR